jgi:RNA polymerase sigma factor (sigma-70 family)
MFARLAVLEEGTEEYQYVRNTLIELNMALVRFAARRFSNRTEQIEDILQVGTIGLIKAIDRFDPDYGVEFVTFAIPTITGEIKRFFRDTNWSVRVPRRLQELRIDLAKATDALAAELDRAPTTNWRSASGSRRKRGWRRWSRPTPTPPVRWTPRRPRTRKAPRGRTASAIRTVLWRAWRISPPSSRS